MLSTNYYLNEQGVILADKVIREEINGLDPKTRKQLTSYDATPLICSLDYVMPQRVDLFCKKLHEISKNYNNSWKPINSKNSKSSISNQENFVKSEIRNLLDILLSDKMYRSLVGGC